MNRKGPRKLFPAKLQDKVNAFRRSDEVEHEAHWIVKGSSMMKSWRLKNGKFFAFAFYRKENTASEIWVPVQLVQRNGVSFGKFMERTEEARKACISKRYRRLGKNVRNLMKPKNKSLLWLKRYMKDKCSYCGQMRISCRKYWDGRLICPRCYRVDRIKHGLERDWKFEDGKLVKVR